MQVGATSMLCLPEVAVSDEVVADSDDEVKTGDSITIKDAAGNPG